MAKVNLVFSSLLLLAKNPAYFLSALIFSAVLFFLYIVLNNYYVLLSAAKIKPILLFEVFINQIKLIWEITGPLNVIAIIVVSVIAGLNLSLTLFRVKTTKVFIGRTNLFSLLGVSAGSFGATCSACTTSLIAILGVSGGLAVFPLKGLEFLFLATILLLLSLYFTSKSLAENGIVKL